MRKLRPVMQKTTEQCFRVQFFSLPGEHLLYSKQTSFPDQPAKLGMKSQVLWLTPVIPVTQDAEIRRIMVQC
jgi:hypothetical protein